MFECPRIFGSIQVLKLSSTMLAFDVLDRAFEFPFGPCPNPIENLKRFLPKPLRGRPSHDQGHEDKDHGQQTQPTAIHEIEN